MRFSKNGQRSVLSRVLFLLAFVLAVSLTSFAVEAGVRATVLKQGPWSEAVSSVGARLLEDYGSFVLVELPSGVEVQALTDKGAVADILAGAGRLTLRNGPARTGIVAESSLPASSAAFLIDDYPAGGKGLYIVQFTGPIKDSWRDALTAAGAEIIEYCPEFSYIVRMTPEAFQNLRRAPLSLKSGGVAPVEWTGLYQPAYKFDPDLVDRGGEIPVSVTVLDTAEGRKLLSTILERAKPIQAPTRIPPYLSFKVQLPAAWIPELALEPELYRIDRWQPPELFDEPGAFNVAGQRVNGEVAGFGLAGKPYLDWLLQKGFSAGRLSDFIVDVADTGLDKGNRAGTPWHKDLLAADGTTPRVAYVRDWTTDAGGSNDGVDGNGHGTNCAGIVGALNQDSGTGTGTVSSTGYHFGLGVAPFVRLGGSKVFNFAGAWDLTGTYTQLIENAWNQGARISSNSWGDIGNIYTADCREYDQLVRDAAPGTPGNQPMVVLFAAGNAGPWWGSVGPPGTAKNTITLGAAENWWPSYSTLGWPAAHQNTPGDDIVYYSSRGLTYDGRIKPDLAAIAHGWLSLRGQYLQKSCSAPFDSADPNLYCSFNGTSAATPAAAGAAALVYQYALDHWGGPPSPALLKAALVASARDLAGGIDCQAKDGTGPLQKSINNPSQGWGLIDTGRFLDGTPIYKIDQSVVFGETGAFHRLTLKIADPEKPVRVALVWTDAPGNISGAATKNDLNLEVVREGRLYRGNAFYLGRAAEGGPADWLNNIEEVGFLAGTSGQFEITVRAANINDDGVPGNDDLTDQDFALFVYNATACAALPDAPTGLSVQTAGPNQVRAAWNGVPGATGYLLLRSTVPGGPYTFAAHTAAGVTTAVDAAVSGGTTYFYVVRAENGCESINSSEAPVAATGECRLAPVFDGLQAVTDNVKLTCEVGLQWNPATVPCGAPVVYEVYRSSWPTFTPTPENRIAAGLTGTGFVDHLNLPFNTPLFYIVRAVNALALVPDGNTRSVYGSALGPVETRRYTAQGLPQPITDNLPDGTTFGVSVPDSGILNDIQLNLDLDHPRPADLYVRLGSPGGSRWAVVHNRSANSIRTTFDQLTAPDGPGNMDNFNGISPRGTWGLRVADQVAEMTGTLNGYSLDINLTLACGPGPTAAPGEVSPAGNLRVARGSGSAVTLSITPALRATDHAVFLGTASLPITSLSWTRAFCGLGTAATLTFDPGTPAPGQLFYFIAAGNDGFYEGSYGPDAHGQDRPEANGLACDFLRVTDRAAPAP